MGGDTETRKGRTEKADKPDGCRPIGLSKQGKVSAAQKGVR